MGVIVNAVQDVVLEGRPRVPKQPFGPGIEPDPEVPGAGGDGQAEDADTLSKNFDVGSKTCLIVGELRRLGEGITLGDLKQGILNAGMLSFYVGIAGAASTKGALSSGYKATMIAAAAGAGTLNQQYHNNNQGSQVVQHNSSNSTNECSQAAPDNSLNNGGESACTTSATTNMCNNEDGAQGTNGAEDQEERERTAKMRAEEHMEIDRITNEEEAKRKGPKPFPPWSNYVKYQSSLTIDTGERPLMPIDPYHKDPNHVPYHTWLDARKEEMKFADMFEDEPAFIEYSDYMSKHPAVEVGLKHVTEYYEREGHLKYAHLVGDSYIHVSRDHDDKIVECTCRVAEDNDVAKVVTYGQHNNKNQLHGLGRKIRIWSRCACDIWEGNFKDGKLDDFGRWITVYWTNTDVPDSWDGKFASYVGYWLDNEVHGYGKMVHTEGDVDEGWFEKTFFRKHPETIESYDYKDDRMYFKAGYIKSSTRARKLNWEELVEVSPPMDITDRMDFHQDEDDDGK